MARTVGLLTRFVNMAKRFLPSPIERYRGYIARRRLPVRVNYDSALGVSTVWSCISFIAGGIAQLPCDVRKKKAKGGSDPQPDHPAYWLLDHRANPEMSAYSFRELYIHHVCLFGNFYAEIERDRAGRPIALWPIDPVRVSPRRDENGDLMYMVSNIGGGVKIYPADMFHIPGLGYDGIVGYSVVEFAARSLGLSIASEEYGSSFFANSGVPSSVLEHPKQLSKEAQKRLEAHITGSSKGVYNSQDTMILEEGMVYKAIGLPPEQAQFLATRRFTVEDICRWFNVPPSKVGHFEKISYRSAEQLSLDVVSECLVPWIRKFEQESDYKLLSNNWSGLYTKVDLRGQLRATHEARAAYYKDLNSMGVYSINDIRELEDHNPIKNGDLHLVPLNMAPLDDVASGKFQPGAADAAPAKLPDKTQTNEPNPPGVPNHHQLTVVEQERNDRLLAILDETITFCEQHALPKPNGAGSGQKLLN